jgi:peroxiredoxin
MPGRWVVFVFPSIGGPDSAGLLDDWTAIPGARGCTPEACAFRDELAEFARLGARVVGISSQSPERHRRSAAELRLPYPLASDETLALADAPGLPTFEFHGTRYFKRLTLIVAGSVVESALYPVFPPGDAASQALRRLRPIA